MCPTCNNVVHMSKMIQVRNVPDDVHRILKTRAAAAGMSLSDYIKRDLEQSARQLSLEELDARIRSRPASDIRTESILEALRELRES